MKTQPVARVPAGVFRGQNFITPELVEYRRGNLSGRTVYVEVSRERSPYWSQTVDLDPNGGPIFGVTLRHADGSRLDPDPSNCCDSMEDVTQYLESL